jgi:hypothetical protein
MSSLAPIGTHPPKPVGILLASPPRQESRRLITFLHRLPRAEQHHHQGRIPYSSGR